MKPKYIYSLLLLAVLHYETGRLINSMRPIETDEETYDKGVKLWIRRDEVKPQFISHPRVISVVSSKKKKQKHKNRTAGVLFARTYPARAKP